MAIICIPIYMIHKKYVFVNSKITKINNIFQCNKKSTALYERWIIMFFIEISEAEK